VSFKFCILKQKLVIQILCTLLYPSNCITV